MFVKMKSLILPYFLLVSLAYAANASNVFWSEALGYPRCNHCDVVISDSDGEWGLKNNVWCGIDSEMCHTTTTTTTPEPEPTVFWSEVLGYPRCNHCDVVISDSDGEWGLKNNVWCGIDSKMCHATTTTTTPEPEPTVFWSEVLGYPRCRFCNVVISDSDGKWGLENNVWCGIDSEMCNTLMVMW